MINRKLVHIKYGGHCAYCGCDITVGTMQVDHIKAKRAGGTDDIENLNPSCRACNNFKATFSIEDFRRELEMQIHRARRYSVNFRMSEKYGLVKVVDTAIVFYFEFNT